MSTRRIIGIDPGLNTTGVGILERDAEEKLTCLYVGTVSPPRSAPIQERLLKLQEGVRELIKAHAPGCLAIEEAFHHKNVKAALILGQARGAALLAAAEVGLEVIELSPKTVKLAAVGHGNAAKEQVAMMVTTILGLPAVPKSPDACDALAVALAALNRIQLPAGLRQ